MTLILCLLASGPVVPAKPAPLALFLAGLLLVTWAALAMGLRRVKTFPEPGRTAPLATGGPYRFIRHPMYAAALLIAAGWVLARPTPARGVLWLGLLAVLVLKLRREEHLLGARYPCYGEYARTRKRLIPFVY
jgi:protein-S-isoprenylcysteine O-methyltransferase Ste14